MSECAHMGQDGRCLGRYHGIACIGDRCQADRAACEHLSTDGGYCHKHRRFICVGIEECQKGIGAARLRGRNVRRRSR